MAKPIVPPGKAKNTEATLMTINEGQYCLVNIPTNDTVLQGPQRLPQNWQTDDGTWHYNINNSDLWDDDALRSIGWYPYILIDTGSPGTGYTRTLDPFVITPTAVTQDAVYTQQDIEVLRQQKIRELEIQVNQYSTNEFAADSLLSEDVRTEQAWVETQTIALLKLTDWQAVSDFDTTKPTTLPISNTYQGQRYVSQGLTMQSQNDNAISAGLSAPWDQTELNSFIASNELAAQDITGGTPAVPATYVLRQGTVTPSDRFSSLLIYRSERLYAGRQTPDPSIEMVLTNKQDARDLYCFLYLQSGNTYLEWIKFELDPADGRWKANSSVNVISWVDSDLKFIFSYGTNPAVQQDYFTNEILFDAGGEQITIRIRWDAE